MKPLPSACTAACRWLVTASVLMLVGLAVGDAKAQDQAKDATLDRDGVSVAAATGSNVYTDDFERDDLGDRYSVVESDPNRLAISGGKLVIVGTTLRKNIVLLKEKFPGDFVATVIVAMEVGQDNFVGLTYHVDQKNYLLAGVAGGRKNLQIFEKGPPPVFVPSDRQLPARRQPFFLKTINDEPNLITPRLGELGDRILENYSPDVERWYLQLRRDGARYTGLVSADGVRWTRIGSHVMVQSYGQLGFTVGSGGGIENAAEFETFSVQQ